MKRGKLLKTAFVTLMVCATAGTLFACGGDPVTYKAVYVGGEGATGDAPATVSYKKDEKFTLANNTFTKEGYTFDGWSDGSQTYLEGVEYTMGEADVTFTAQWKQNSTPVTEKYTVTYALGTNAASTATAPAKVSDLEKNAQVTLPAAPAAAEGYEFTGWKVGSEATLKQPNDKITVTANVTVTAQWKKSSTPVTEKFTVTYAVGDHAASTATAPAKVSDLEKNAQVTLPAAPAAAEGYEFTGWKVGSEATLKQPNDKITVTANVTVTAQWKEKAPVVDDKYATDAEVKDQIKPLWDPTLSYYVADGEEVTVQATLTSANAFAYTGILTDMNINDDWYRFRPDAAVFGWKPWNTWDPASDTNVIPTELTIDNTNWDATKYLGLFADGASCIQVVNIGLKENVVTVTVTNYAGTDTTLATPVTSAKYSVTLTADTSEIKPIFYTDGGAVISTASAKYAKASNTYVNLTFDFDTEGTENAVVPMRPGKAKYVFDTDPVKAGYTFGGWKSSDTADTKLYKNTDEVDVTEAVTYTAQWTQDEYTVTYALGTNAASAATAPEKITGKHHGDKITLPAAPAAAAGYEFDGWQVGNATELKKAGAEVEVTGNVTITAKYKAKAQYTATYAVGDHAAEDATVDPETVYYDAAEITLPAAPAAATGYEFEGWKVGTEAKLKQPTDKITLTEDVTITAQWKAIKYDVTYNVGDHAAENAKVDPVKADYNTEITLPAGPEAAAGWSFSGWKVGTSDTVKQPGEKITVTAATTLTAQWASTENSWTVKFLANEGDETPLSSVPVPKDATGAAKKLKLPETNPTKSGHKFVGWYLSTDESKTVLTEATLPDVESNLTVIAKWQAIYTVTVLDDLEGTAVTGAKTEYNNNGAEGTPEKFVAPTNPTKEGYTFDGWYEVVGEDTKEYGTTEITAETDITKDMTVAAKWVIITYTVTFKVEGKDDVTLSVEYGKKLSETTGFSDIVTDKEYYRFDGWKNGQDTVTGDTIPTADIEYTAAYTQIEALPSANQDPATTPIIINPTNYNPNPMWIGKVHKGEIVTLTGTMTGGPSNWNTATMFIYSGLNPWGNFRIDNHVNYANWATGGDPVGQLSTAIITEENWQVIKYPLVDWDHFATTITDCNITISFDWRNEGHILVTAVITKETNSSTQVYMVSPQGTAFSKDTYSIGLSGDTSTTTINGMTVSKTASQPEAAPTYSANQTPSADSKIEVGAEGNVLAYTGLTPVWNGKIEKGEKVVMSGTMTSAAAVNWNTAILYFYEGAAPTHNLRGDAWVNGFGEVDGKFLIAPSGWDVTRVADIDGEIVDWGANTVKAIYANCDVEITFDFSNVKQCVVTFKATGKDGDVANKVYTCTWTYVMRSGADMGNLNYSIGLGGDAVHILVDSIVRTPAESEPETPTHAPVISDWYVEPSIAEKQADGDHLVSVKLTKEVTAATNATSATLSYPADAAHGYIAIKYSGTATLKGVGLWGTKGGTASAKNGYSVGHPGNGNAQDTSAVGSDFSVLVLKVDGYYGAGEWDIDTVTNIGFSLSGAADATFTVHAIEILSDANHSFGTPAPVENAD